MIEREDFDPAETRECLDALDSVEAFEGVGQVDARRKRAKLSLAAVALPPSAQAGGRQQALRWNCRRNDPIFRVTPLASFTERQTDPGRSYWRGAMACPAISSKMNDLRAIGCAFPSLARMLLRYLQNE